MTTKLLYASYTHASCKRMQAAAMMALSEQVMSGKADCTMKEVELLREVVETMGSDTTRALINRSKD